MIKRLAYFEGSIHPGREAEFAAYIEQRLLPLWRGFPGAASVEILREAEAEEGSHRYPLILAISYPDAAAMGRALASPQRAESREVTKGLLAMFEGRVFHVVYDLGAHAPLPAA